MAKAIKCDCCGKYIDDCDDNRKSKIIVLSRRDLSGTYRTMDICLECDKAIGKLFESRNKIREKNNG